MTFIYVVTCVVFRWRDRAYKTTPTRRYKSKTDKNFEQTGP